MFCQHRDACQIYQRCIVNVGIGGRMRYVWILRYCHAGSSERCARRASYVRGGIPDGDLMPDGSLLQA